MSETPVLDYCCKLALEKYGKNLQVLVAIEELAELMNQLAVHRRDKFDSIHLSEEIADVEIMLSQIKYIFGLKDIVRKFKQLKTAKLLTRLTKK